MPNEHRRASYVLVVALVLCLCPRARAVKTSLQGALTLAGTWTDNPLNAASDGPVPPRADYALSVRPSLILSVGTPRVVQTLSGTFSGDFYLEHVSPNAYSGSFTWGGAFLTSKTTDLLTNASVSYSRLSATPVQDSSATPVTVQRPGSDGFINATLTESLKWEISPRLHLLQALGFISFNPINSNQASTLTLTPHLALEGVFRRDAFSGELLVSYIHFSEVHGPVTATDGTVDANALLTPERQILTTTLLSRWRHDFGHFWLTELGLGAIAIARIGGSNADWQPAANASLRYVHPAANLELAYLHSAPPDPIVAQVFASDSVVLRALVPLGAKSRVALSASAGYAHNATIDTDAGTTRSAAHVGLVDATLSWRPIDEITISTRYAYNVQSADSGAVDASNAVPIASFMRHTVIVSVAGLFPATAAVIVPGRRPMRVDASSESLIAEPHSEPEPHAEPEPSH
jgi:hypothetical protein